MRKGKGTLVFNQPVKLDKRLKVIGKSQSSRLEQIYAKKVQLRSILTFTTYFIMVAMFSITCVLHLECGDNNMIYVVP